MKAIQVVKPGQIEIVSKPVPEIVHPDDILVKTKAVGICYSDIHIYHGTSPFAVYPRVIGHEVVGIVEKIGSAASKLKVGDPVVLEPIDPCGECYACRIGRPNVCAKLQVRGVNNDGGFQEYFIARESKLHRFPETISWTDAVMLEPFTIGAQICFRGDVRANDLVLIIGAGPTGLSALENAKITGATCIVSDINNNRLRFAREFGADYTFNPQEVDLFQAISELSNGMMCNVVVDAAGTPETLEQGMSLASVAGRIVNIGFTDTTAKVSMLEITRKELSLVGSRLQTFQFEKCIGLFSTRKINTTRLITHVFPFQDIAKAIELIESKDQSVGKIILTF